MSVVASLVIGADGSTSPSHKLSNEIDRQSFLQFRSTMDCIITGGRTFRSESYMRTPVPLIVITRNVSGDDQSRNPDAHFWNIPLSDAIKRAQENFGENIHLEGGIHLLRQALDEKLVEKLRITITKESGGNDFIDVEALTCHFDDITRVENQGNIEILAKLPK